MSEKRRDNRGRILHNGESQRSDGRYMFKYIDGFGQTKYVYSWRLDKNDRILAGRQRDLSRYISLKTGVRHNTQANYNFVIHILEKEEFGKKRIDKVKISDAKGFLIKLQKDGRGYSSVISWNL